MSGNMPGRARLPVVIAVVASHTAAVACPFCNVVGRTLAERRDSADAVAVAEADGQASADDAGLAIQPFRTLQAIKADPSLPPSLVARVAAPLEGTALVFLENRRWTAIAADEALIAHVAAAPAVTDPPADRLKWFAPKLEHPQSAIADDAFAEFGLAPFEAVRDAAGSLDAAKLREWVASEAGDQRRRGFYGLALGLSAAADSAPGRRRSIEALRAAVSKPSDDFRAGFDGVLAGLLVAEGEASLERLDRLGLLDAHARPIDQRHVLAALRFAWEHLADSIPRKRVADATARLLASPAVAADAVTDLARYEAWDRAEEVAAAWDASGADDPLVRRAVAGYLTACPTPRAAPLLEAIRRRDPRRLDEAIRAAASPLAR